MWRATVTSNKHVQSSANSNTSVVVKWFCECERILTYHGWRCPVPRLFAPVVVDPGTAYVESRRMVGLHKNLNQQVSRIWW